LALPGDRHAYWIRATQEDSEQAWTSPVYLDEPRPPAGFSGPGPVTSATKSRNACLRAVLAPQFTGGF
jgi:hypothetical protein